MFRYVLLLLLWQCVALPLQAAQRDSNGTSAPRVVLINPPESANDTRYLYPEELLRQALRKVEKQYGPSKVQRTGFAMSRDRFFVELERGQYIHVMAEAPKPGWEDQLIPVRIPIRKGIQGYRVFLIKQKNQPLLDSVLSLQDLMALPTGSGAQWSTAAVMARAGFTVVEGSNYESLFRMLELGRFVTFGRGINEAFAEQQSHVKAFPDLVVDRSLLLYIPLPTYFFVTPKQPELAQQIEDGLQAMLADGSFDRLFYQYYGQEILQADLEHRRRFSIDNPNLSVHTPLDDARLWFDPQRDLPRLKRMLAPQ